MARCAEKSAFITLLFPNLRALARDVCFFATGALAAIGTGKESVMWQKTPGASIRPFVHSCRIAETSCLLSMSPQPEPCAVLDSSAGKGDCPVKVREFLEQLKDLPPETRICVAELDEAFAANIAEIDVIENARIQSRQADGHEAVELGNGGETVVVIRW